jgi:hypothetical protein
MKIRCKFTVDDYFEYVGSRGTTSGLVQRVKSSMPSEFRDGYNMKFKKLKNGYYTCYRISITVRKTEKQIQDFLEFQKNYCNKANNFSYKIIG